MSYEYRRDGVKPQIARSNEQMRAELQRLNQLRAAILAETEAQAKELARIKSARQKLIPIATYAPTPTALAFREQYGHLYTSQPTPIHGGSHGLRMAADEAAYYEARKREKDGPGAQLGRGRAA